jgi:hypothetical protein
MQCQEKSDRVSIDWPRAPGLHDGIAVGLLATTSTNSNTAPESGDLT